MKTPFDPHGETSGVAPQPGEERLRAVLDAVPVGIATFDRDGCCLSANEAIARAIGATREQVLARNYHDNEAWRREGLLEKALLAARERVPQRHVLTGRSSFGVDVVLDCYLAPLGTDELLLVAHDISERRRAERALQANEALLRRSQQIGRIGSYELDIARDTWTGTGTLYEVLGVPPDGDRTVDGWLACVHPADREQMGTYFLEHVVGRRQLFDREYRVVRQTDGEERWVWGWGELAFDESGNPLTMIGTIQDVTERRRAQEEKARLEVQLFQAQKMEGIGRLAGGVAHDFNNMLSVILGYTDLIKDSLPVGDPLRAEIGQIESAGLHARDITRQLLAFSRKEIIAPRILDLNLAVQRTRGTLARLIGEDVALRFLPGADLWKVHLDRSQVDQILVNLAGNARHAMPTGGSLTIETSNVLLDEDYCRTQVDFAPGRYVSLVVSDDGVGMDAEVLSHVFEPFFTTRGPGEGTGLGLATVYGIVKQNGGLINVYSEPGHGTTFRIYFPSAAEDRVREEEVQRRPIVRGSGAVLLVEDDPLVRRVTASMLAAIGYTVLPAETPEEAIALAARPSVHIDLLLSDVVMPKMSGTVLRDRVVALRPGIGVLFMSGYTSNVIVRHGVLQDGVNFLHKPFSKADLALEVVRALQDPRRSGG